MLEPVPYRRQDSGVKAKHGRWEIRHDPDDISRIWIRNHHHGGWLSATWTHLRTGPVPFGELIWTHSRQVVAARGTDPVTEAEIAAVAADLLDRAGKNPAPQDGQAPARQRNPAGSTPSARSRRVRGRTAATAAPQWPRPEPGPGDDGIQDGRPAGRDNADGRDEEQDGQDAGTASAQVIPLPLFDARKEAEKWW